MAPTPTAQVWSGEQFVDMKVKDAETVKGKAVEDFASASHQHLRASITDFSHKSTHAIGGADALTPGDIGALALSGGTMSGKIIVAVGGTGGIHFPDNAFGGTGDSASITLQNPTGGENSEMTFMIGNEGGDIFNFKGTGPNVMKVNDLTVWNAGNFDPGGKANVDHDHTYSVNGSWLGYKNDSSTVKIHGNTRQMAFRTDGATEYAAGVGNYPFAFMYGGDAAANRLMTVSDTGDVWTKKSGWLSESLAGKVDRVSATRPGVTKLYRNDADTNTSVQVDWTGSYWRLRGYAGDALHAECWVGVAGNAEKVGGFDAAEFVIPFSLTGGSATAYTATFSPTFAKVTGRTVRIHAHVASGASPTLNANGTGAAPIRKADGSAATLSMNGIYTLTYSASGGAFILQGEGGESSGQLYKYDQGGTSGPTTITLPFVPKMLMLSGPFTATNYSTGGYDYGSFTSFADWRAAAPNPNTNYYAAYSGISESNWSIVYRVSGTSLTIYSSGPGYHQIGSWGFRIWG